MTDDLDDVLENMETDAGSKGGENGKMALEGIKLQGIALLVLGM